MAEVFSGAVLGYALSLVAVWPISLGLVRARSSVPFWAKAIAPNVRPLMLAVPLSLVMFTWGPLMGIILGILYRGAVGHFPQAGLGSPNWPYTVGVIAFAAAVLAIGYYIWAKLSWWAVVLAVVWVGAFGWGLPYLARAAP